MHDGVDFAAVLLPHLYRLSCRKNKQFDLASLGFAVHFVHYGEPAVSAGANYTAALC
jgi:hypothetical protein